MSGDGRRDRRLVQVGIRHQPAGRGTRVDRRGSRARRIDREVVGRYGGVADGGDGVPIEDLEAGVGLALLAGD